MNSAKFYKVSYEQFQTGMEKEDVKDIYDAIKLPRRATKGSAGYDFYTPIDIHLGRRNSKDSYRNAVVK